MLSRLDSRELSEWFAYYRVSPWTQERADIRSGLIAQILANVNRDPKKHPSPYRIEQFLAVPQPKKATRWQVMKSALKALCKR